MDVIWGIVVVVLAALAWGGQTLSWLAPPAAVRWGLREADSEVDPVYAADIEGEAMWDAFTLWTLLAAGVLLLVDHRTWPYFGLVGGGMYVYFAGRGIATRVVMRSRGHRVGSESSLTTALTALVIWGLAGLVTIVVAIIELRGR